MANNYFRFKQFIIFQDRSAFKVGTDGVILGAYAGVSNSRRVLDIGTGTGLIALMLAQRCDADIIGIEPDYDSYVQACENVGLCNWRNRIRIENCDLQRYIPCGGSFDLIVANPPYFTGSLTNPDPVISKARHTVTLDHTDILKGTERLLGLEGMLQVILPYSEGNVFKAKAKEFGFYCSDILKIKPVPSGEIKRMILSFRRERSKGSEKFLIIEKGKRHEFTEDYISLTKDYYLNF